jgi:hypothetical protein
VSFDGTLRFHASLRSSVPQGYSFFLPQALLPFLPTHKKIQLNKEEKQG